MAGMWLLGEARRGKRGGSEDAICAKMRFVRLGGRGGLARRGGSPCLPKPLISRHNDGYDGCCLYRLPRDLPNAIYAIMG
jgi:hypothetical protein